MLVASLLLIVLKKEMSQMATSEEGIVALFVQPNVDATNRASSVLRDSIVDSIVKRYLKRIYLYRSLMYVDRLVLSSKSVALFRTKEFSTYNVRSRCYRNSVKVSTRT